MSIGKRVSEAIEKMDAGDPESALFAICAAIDASAVKEFGEPGRSSYKKFILQNLGIITHITFEGIRFLDLYLGYTHPQMKMNAKGAYPVEEILYHAVRCGLYHEARLPANLRISRERRSAVMQGCSFCHRL